MPIARAIFWTGFEEVKMDLLMRMSGSSRCAKVCCVPIRTPPYPLRMMTLRSAAIPGMNNILNQARGVKMFSERMAFSPLPL